MGECGKREGLIFSKEIGQCGVEDLCKLPAGT